MIINLYNELYDLSEKIYKNYRNKDKINELLEKEESLYDSQDYDTLLNLYDYALYTSKEANIEDYDNYELVCYGEIPALVIRRIFYKAMKKITEYELYEDDYCQEEKSAAFIEPNIIYVSNDIEKACYQLQDIIYANIEARFLYFLTIEKDKIENKEKYIKNLVFISPYLEEKVRNATSIENLVKSEDFIYDNLWENMKAQYNLFLIDYAISSIEKDIIIMHSKRDFNNDNNTKIRELYLRTLFNYLDEETIEEINSKYKSEDLYVYNKVGYNSILEAFKLIEEDKENINKIKTR